MTEPNRPTPAALLRIKVVPGARQDRIMGCLGDAIKIRTSAPPEGGRANDRVMRLIATALDIPQTHLKLLRGHANPNKVLQIDGLTQAQVNKWVESII
ncbi:MAG: DUF167 domain-containing protein [Phycisphaerales bacterium]|nr:DUF167 domain-containing protein [Phycisphaerales bacterium]